MRRFTEARRRLALAGSTLAAAAAIGCAGAPTPLAGAASVVPLGNWGGDSAGAIVGDTAMHLHVACTYGDVSGRVPVAADGSFDVAGTYVLRAYPIAVGPTLPARFVGRLEGTRLTVRVIVDDTVAKQTVVRGPVVVSLGTSPRLGPCPICRRPLITQRRVGR